VNTTDKEIDEGLQKLASLAPHESVWQDIESKIIDQKADINDSGFNKGLFVGSGVAAVIMVSAIFVFYMLIDYSLEGDRVLALNKELSQNESIQAELRSAGDFSGSKLFGAGGSVRFEAQQAEQRPGKHVRHLYAGDEALWDAMLENEISLVDQTMLYSPPREQQKLWQYRNKLTEQLAALRGQPKPEKYLF
jgi:hypothetical protein